MAIILLTQKNFTKVVSEKLDDMDGMGLIAAAIMGGKNEMKKMIDAVPDENKLWVNTDHVVAASVPVKVDETGEVVFRIYFTHPDKDNPCIWVKGDDYKRFMFAWAGEVKPLNEGEYEVPNGYRATSKEDGSKVTVEKIEKED